MGLLLSLTNPIYPPLSFPLIVRTILVILSIGMDAAFGKLDWGNILSLVEYIYAEYGNFQVQLSYCQPF